MDYLQVTNWKQFQHYTDRNPPWIKLHNQLLDNYEFECLPDASKAHLLCIWMLASRTSNKIPANNSWIAKKIGASELVDTSILISSGFLELIHDVTECNQDASMALQSMASKVLVSEEESRGENKDTCPSSDEPVVTEKINFQEVARIYNETFPNLKQVSLKLINDKRKRTIKKLFKFADMNLDRWELYLDAILNKESCQWMLETRPNNQTGQTWRAKDFDYFITEGCYIKVKEG